MVETLNPKEIAQNILSEIDLISVKNAPNLRKIRKEYSHRLKNTTADKTLYLARELVQNSSYRWIAFELLLYHPQAFKIIFHIRELLFGCNFFCI